MATLEDLSRQLSQLKKQIPFATAQAMTEVARKIAAAQKVALERKLESPTPFTVNSVGSQGARKNNLVAKVYVREKAAEYLEPFEFGGEHKLNSQALLNPKNIKLNKYGNLGNRKMATRKKDNTFIGDVKGVAGLWKRKKTKHKRSRRGKKRSPNGTRRPREKMRPPVLLIRFGDQQPVTPVLGYMDRSRAMAEALMPGALSRAIADAIRTAK